MTTTARRARIATRPTELIPVGTLVEQGRRQGSDQLDQIKASIAKLTAKAREIGMIAPNPDSVVDLVGEQLADEILTTGQVPDDLVERIATADAEYRRRARQVQVLDFARRILDDRKNTATRDAADGGLRWLHVQLTDLLQGVRTLAPDLDGITSAEDALTHGKEDAYRQIRLTVQQYVEIRAAQRVLTADARSGQYAHLDLDLRHAGITRTPTDEKYSAAIGLIDQYEIVGSQPRTEYQPLPWPGFTTDSFTEGSIPSTTPIEYLIWIAKRDDAWVPTNAELTKALEKRQQAIDNAREPIRAQITDEANPGKRSLVVFGAGHRGDAQRDLRRDLARRGRNRIEGAPQWP